MRSFRLHIESKAELIWDAIALAVGVGVFFLLRHWQIAELAWRIGALLAAAVFVGYLLRGRLCRTLRQRYPNARWIGLLAVGMTVLTFGVIARFVVPGAQEGFFMLPFILLAGACIATFVVANRKDPDVTR